MNHKKEKSNFRIVVTFIAVLFVCILMGYAVGKGLAGAEKHDLFTQTIEDFDGYLVRGTSFLFIISTALGIVIPAAFFLSCNSMYKTLQKDMENDDLWDALEDRLNVPMIFADTFSLINLCLFYCMLYISMHNEGNVVGVAGIIGYVLYVVSVIANLVVIKMVVDIEKKLNPEKRGNPLDFNFQKEWMESSDEAQRIIAYKAAYKSFVITRNVTFVLFAVVFVIIDMFKLDLFALIVLGIVMLVNNLSYMLTAAKLEKRL